MFSDHRTPLHWVMREARSIRSACGCSAQSPCAEHKELALVLLYSGPDVNAQSTDGNTPLHEAVLAVKSYEVDERQMIDIIALLLQAGADPNLNDNAGASPLALARLDSCQYALDGECNEDGVNCATGTDTTDCAGGGAWRSRGGCSG